MRQWDPARKGQRLYGRRQVAASFRMKGEGERQRLPTAFAIAKGEKEVEAQDSSCTDKSTEKMTELDSAWFIPYAGILHQTVHCLVGKLSAGIFISLLCAYMTHLQNNLLPDCMEVSWGVSVAAVYSGGLRPYIWNTKELQLQLVNLICSSTTRMHRKNLVMFPALKLGMKQHLGRKNCACSIKSCLQYFKM